MHILLKRLFVFLVISFFSFSANSASFEVRLTWVSGAQPTDLDLSVQNSAGQVVDWGHRSSTWGATHTLDNHGTANSSSYESFTIDTQKMDCAGGRYDFYISHWSGPSIASTITALQNGNTVAGPFNFRTTVNEKLGAVTYTAVPQNCTSSNPILSNPSISTMVDGNDLLGLLVFPATLNSGTSFTTTIDVPTNYSVKRVEILKSALEIRNERLRIVANSLKTDTLWLFTDTAIGFIPVIGDVASFARGGYDVIATSLEDIASANANYVAATTRTVRLINPRNVKILIWYTKIGAGSASPTVTTIANF
jgi:hypothetical protein